MPLFILVLVSFAAAYLAVMMGVLARRKPGYRHGLHTISELGEVSAPDQRFVALGLFLPVGLALGLAAAFLMSRHEALAALAGAVAAGYILAALFPCDRGSPISGSARQAVHKAGGAMEYLGGGYALLNLAEVHGAPFSVAGVIVLIAAALLTVLPAKSLRGLVQRLAETVLFLALLYGILRLQ
ncbi:DUF998 domain-containing protein [Paucibacter sp. Y2R2-4]|uniref:DUF998 domain-containing protein n=1 Tax=Paucibacter sp. Y2R2-4 TaxID=2893553 RepID=UPI0021E498EE|nr:DUF998 domain-containing protein [Paucibacter sp. Y2R2-4]MCV2351524.1 DUF998 domain-containing protein [Paucibacter sp. Y2R2-4]